MMFLGFHVFKDEKNISCPPTLDFLEAIPHYLEIWLFEGKNISCFSTLLLHPVGPEVRVKKNNTLF